MKRFNSSTAFLIAVFLLILLLSISAFQFFSSLNSKYVLIQNGVTPVHYVLDNYKYLQNKKGLIFTITMLISAISFFIMVVLPSDEVEYVQKNEEPNKSGQIPRKESPISAIVEKQVVEEIPEQAAMAPPAPKESSPAEIQIPEDEDLEEFDDFIDEIQEITEGEDDVVYGTGEITNAAIMDFVHKYPDSSLKFLYRKQLDGKGLTTEEEAIYRDWEDRGMSRSKIKAYILSLMEWHKMPQEPLYDIWKKMRDHIFETIS